MSSEPREGAAPVAVLGTGIMGAAMARNLLGSGLPVRAWNRTREKAEPLAEAGAELVGTPREAAEGASAAIVMVRDAAAARDVLEGPDGALAPLAAAGGVLVQMGTVGIDATDHLARIAAGAGVPYVDAPVLGTKAPAEEGQLLVLASGPDEVRAQVQPLFDAMGRETRWLGPAGAGTRLKIVIQNWILSVMEGVAETVALARALGVDPDAFLDAIEGGPLGVPYARLKGRMMIDGEYPVSFPLEGAVKDVGLVLDAAVQHGLELGLAPVIRERFERAVRLGHGEKDMAAAYEGSAPA